MNSHLNFEISKLLKEKGFNEKCSHYYIDNFMSGGFKHDGVLYKTSLPNDWNNENIFQFVERTKQPHLCNAPTICQAVMWLYEKHGIWIDVSLNQFSKPKDLQWMYSIVFTKECTYSHSSKSFNSPTEAYEAAIKHTLENLL